MTFPNSNTAPTNTHTRPETVAERHGYTRLAQQGPPRGLWARVRPWMIGVAAGLTLGGAAAFAVSYQVMPIHATQVENMVIDLNGDGQPDFLVNGYVVFSPLPKAPASPAAGQP